MIYSLYIKNYIIIDEVTIYFDNGLNIITGETGSGKSLIIKALSILLGSKYEKNSIRKNENQCLIEGNFLIHNKNSFY